MGVKIMNRRVISVFVLVLVLLGTVSFVNALLPDIDYLALHGSNIAEFSLIDDEYADGKASSKSYAFYNRLDASLYIGDFEIGATANLEMPRLLPYQPPRFQRRMELSKLYLGVDIEPAYVQVGTFEKTLEYGITLYSVEDRDLNRENYLKGVMADIEPVDGLEVVGLGGVGNWEGQLQEYTVKAGKFKVTPLSFFNGEIPLVASFDMSISHLGSPDEPGFYDHRLWSVGATATHYLFDVSFIKAYHKDYDPFIADGDAIYFSASGNIMDFVSVGFQYKDYQDYSVPFTQLPPVSVFEKSINSGLDEKDLCLKLQPIQ
jgi:hypothetical protein